MNYYIREYGVTKAEGFRLAWQDTLQDLGDTMIGSWIEGSLSSAGQNVLQNLKQHFGGQAGQLWDITEGRAPENNSGLPFSPELYRMGLELVAPDGYGEGTYVTAPLPGIRNNN